MAEQSDHNSTWDQIAEIEKLFNDEEFCRWNVSPNETPGNVNETLLSTMTTPDPLNTAFIDETNVYEQHSQSDQQQSQTTNETSSVIHGLVSTLIEQEHETIDVHTPRKTMISTGTMPRTPIMISTGTMPRTPIMISTGTMPRTPIMVTTETIDLVSPTIETIDLVSPDILPDTSNIGSPLNLTPK